MSGTIGDVAFAHEDYLYPMNSNQDIAKIQIKENRINPYFVYIFLLTSFGQNQIIREGRGSVQQHIFLSQIEQLLIPILSNIFQVQIEKLVKFAHSKLEQSKILYKEAENLLLKELDLLDFKPTTKNIAIKSFSESFGKSGRLDAEYYQPKYDEVEEKIKSYGGGFDYIENIVNWEKGVEVGSKEYKEGGKAFIRISDFSKYGIENISKKISNELYEDLKDKFKPNIGDILFTKDGTIGISYVMKENIDGILSGAFLKLTLKEEYQDFSKETLSLIFNSIVSKMQVEKLSGGAIIAHLKPSDFETFVIPIINTSIQTQIEEKIQKSFQLKKESKELLELAKKAVEIAIEEGEEVALKYIKEEK